MNKTERLALEASARQVITRFFNTSVLNQRVTFSEGRPLHEFDIFEKNTVMGGVSTSTLKTDNRNANTGGKDRAASELLWLTLWPGERKRLHVLTDKSLADWLYKTYKGAALQHRVTIYHYETNSQVLTEIGVLGITEKESS